jgi:hypothetical protein
MFKSAALGLQDAAREKRDSLPVRVAKVQELAHATMARASCGAT